MSAATRILALVGVLLVIALSAAGVAIGVLYDAAFARQRARLCEVAESRARLIEAVGRYDALHLAGEPPEAALEATLGQVREAHARFGGFGETGEFVLGQRHGDQIVFLLSHRHRRLDRGEGTIPVGSAHAEPMRRALQGRSGALIGLDYRGETVLAAHEPVGIYGLGVVAKVDLAEVRAPFVRAGAIAGLVTLVLVAAGAVLILRIGNPLVRSLGASKRRLEREVDEHRRARAALAESEERFRHVIEGSPLAMAVVETDGAIGYVNPAFTGMLGYAREDVPTLADFWSAAYPAAAARDEAVAAYARYLEELERLGRAPAVRAVQVRCRDGSERWVELSGSRMACGRSLLLLQDVSEQRRLEEQLVQAQKLEAVGRLSGGVAHDFSNILTVVHTAASLLEMDLPKDDALLALVRDVREAAERGDGLTRQLLAFSRRQVLQPEIVDVNVLLAGMDRMLRRLIGEDIDLRTVLQQGIGPVEADPGQLEQVVMNLVVNARDAMPSGGELTIETAEVDLDGDYAEAHAGVAPGPHVRIAVSDTGCGMDTETRQQAFEPFFTTKARGRGTGLGLATVHGIVKQSGGHIWVYSEPGRGTTFKIHLPHAERSAAPRPGGPGSRPARRSAAATILVVEDADVVRRQVVRILGAEGHSVLAAGNGQEAVELAGGFAGGIDLLLTDVVMPGMSGRALAGALQEARPGLGVLYMSGYTDDAIVHHGVLDPGTHFLQKPFSREALLAKVDEVLGAARAAAGRGALPEA